MIAMPYFIWRGIDAEHNLWSGYTFARTPQELLLLMHAQQIGIVHYAAVRFFLTRKNISRAQKAALFKQLAILLEAGVLVPQALALLLEQTAVRDLYMREMLATILSDIQHGISCAQAFGEYRSILGNLTIALIHAGEETGQLGSVLHLMSHYWYDRLLVSKQLRSALMVPAITFSCFILIVFLLLYWVVPVFATIFANADKPLPPATAAIIAISSYAQAVGLVHLVMLLITLCMVYTLVRVHERMRFMFDTVLLRIPLLSSLQILSISIGIAQSLAILVKGGVPLVQALQLAREVIHNQAILQIWQKIINAVDDGMPLSKAVEIYGNGHLAPQMSALMALGEEAEQLDLLLLRLTQLLQERLHTITQHIAQLLQPFCMIVLGCLIAFLIVAIYMPLFDISHMISTW